MRKSLKIAGIGCGGLLLLAGAAMGWLSWELRPQPPDADLPELMQNLHGNVRKAQLTFRQRVETRFPVGSAQSSLIAELKRQGFTLRDATAHFEQSSFPCVRDWNISWVSGPDGRIQKIAPYYLYTCP
ncbi:MAG TPA: hypothetical protein VJ798_00060 [Rhizomicrobium sp.]|nr:hypothetical protein [Rhizomicrobium sp.]